MTTIHLVRHAQASFGSADYDRLSEKGIRQAQAVGDYLARLEGGVSAASSGCLRRQLDTARHALAALESGIELAVTPAFNEYLVEDILKSYLPVVAAANARIAEAKHDIHKDKRLYMEILGEVARLWANGTDGPDGPVAETWASFRARVNEGIRSSVSGRNKNDTLAVFTSGGVIATIIGDILELSPEKTFALNWRIHNASISEIYFGRTGFALSSFNSVAHLRLPTQPDLVTYW